MTTSAAYQELHAGKVIETVETLGRRIRERFPDSGLSRVCERLLAIARQTHAQSEWIARPIVSLRIGIVLLMTLIATGLIGTMCGLRLPNNRLDFFDFVQTLSPA